MTQVWLIDKQGFYTFKTYHVKEVNELEIEIPCNTCKENTFYKPRWDGEKWIEGATQQEIDKINKMDICSDSVKTNKELQEENEQLKAELKTTRKQLQATTQQQEFLESCIMEIAQVVYA